MNRQSPHFNAWSTNPLESRKDVIEALHQQLEPLIPAFTDDGARVSLADTSAVFSMEAAELEGFARPLWGIVPSYTEGANSGIGIYLEQVYPMVQIQVNQNTGGCSRL